MSVQSKKFKVRNLGNADLWHCNGKSILEKYSIQRGQKKEKGLRENIVTKFRRFKLLYMYFMLLSYWTALHFLKHTLFSINSPFFLFKSLQTITLKILLKYHSFCTIVSGFWQGLLCWYPYNFLCLFYLLVCLVIVFCAFLIFTAL